MVTFAEAVINEKHEELVQVLKNGFCKCGVPGEESHYCPFQSDVHDNHEFECNCCPSCQSDCADDI